MERFSPLMRDAHQDAKLALFEQGLVVFSEFLAALGIELLVLGPLSFLREAKCEPSAAAPQWFAPNGAACIYYSQEATLARQTALRDKLNRLQEDGKIRVLDLMALFSAGQECRFFGSDGVLLYRNEYSHPTAEICVSARWYLAGALK